MEQEAYPAYVEVTHAVRGWIAQSMVWDGEMYIPHNTSIGEYRTHQEARVAALEWAENDELEFRDPAYDLSLQIAKLKGWKEMSYSEAGRKMYFVIGPVNQCTNTYYYPGAAWYEAYKQRGMSFYAEDDTQIQPLLDEIGAAGWSVQIMNCMGGSYWVTASPDAFLSTIYTLQAQEQRLILAVCRVYAQWFEKKEDQNG